MAAISHVFTIRRAAQILGRDEDLLWELSDQLEPEDGKLWVCDIDGAETPRLHPRWHRGSSRNYQGSDRSRRLISRRGYRGAQRMLTDKRGAIMLRQKWSRGQAEARLANLPPCLIGMEACVGAHHLSRKLRMLGHDARLMPAKYVRLYSKGQKND